MANQIYCRYTSCSMASIEYIPGPDGKRIEVTVSSGEDFMSLTNFYFLMGGDEAHLHVNPRDIKLSETLGILQPLNAEGQRMCESCSVIDIRNPPSLSSEGDWSDFADTQNESVEEDIVKGASRIEGHFCDLGHFLDDFRISTCTLC